MATTFSVQEILTDVAQLSNCPAFSTTTRIPLSRAVYWIAQSSRALCALLRQHQAVDREYIQTATVQTSPGYRLVSLPADCGEVLSVLWHRTATDYELMDSASAQHLEGAPLAIGKGWDDSSAERPRWRMEGQSIAIYPPSGIAESLEIYHTTHVAPTAGTFQARVDFDRWVTLDVCAKVATAKRREPGQFHQDKALLENDLLARARKRDANERHTIRDVRGGGAYYDRQRGWVR